MVMYLVITHTSHLSSSNDSNESGHCAFCASLYSHINHETSVLSICFSLVKIIICTTFEKR